MDDLEASEGALVKYKEEYQGKLVKLLQLLAEHGPVMQVSKFHMHGCLCTLHVHASLLFSRS